MVDNMKKLFIALLILSLCSPCSARVIIARGSGGADATQPEVVEGAGTNIDTNGTLLTVAFSEAVSEGGSYDDADWTLTCSTTGPLTIAHTTGDGTSSWGFAITGGPVQESGTDTCTLDWAGTADGVEDGSGNDLAAIDPVKSIVNGSTQGGASVVDTFTDTDATALVDHTSDSSHTWTLQGGPPLYITGNKMVAGSSGESGHTYSSFVPTDADYTVYATFALDSSSGVTPMIGGRASTSANTWYGVRYGSGTWYLYSIVDGSESSIGTYVGDDPTTPEVVELIMNGTTISVEINDVERISVTDSSISDKGRPCVGSYYSDVNEDRNLDNYGVID
jgi:hypothetical protein